MKKKLSIGILAEIINSASGARAPIELAVYLSKRGHQVTFYATRVLFDPDAAKYLVDHKVAITIIPLKKIPYLNRLIGAITLWKMLRNSHHDVLQAQVFPLFNIASQLSSTPVITGYHGSQFFPLRERFTPGDSKYSFFYIFDCLLNVYLWFSTLCMLTLSKEICPISQYCNFELEKLYFRKGHTIYLAPGQIAKKYTHKPSSKFTLLSVSRITPYKGFHLVIEAFRHFYEKHPNSKLIIAGSQPLPKYLRFLQSISKGLPIEIIVNPNDRQLSSLYSRSDVYVGWDRNLFFGMPPLEAAMRSIPSIIYKSKAAKELITHSVNGYLVTGMFQLIYYLELLSQKPQLRKKIGRNAKIYSSKFNWEKTAFEYEQCFYSLMPEFAQVSHKNKTVQFQKI